MTWFRNRLPQLIRLALVLWLLAFAVAAGQGCLSQPPHDPAASHALLEHAGPDHDHAAHASGCLQFCEDTSVSLLSSLSLLSFGHALWVVLFIVPALLIGARGTLPFAFLALQLPAPPAPPARLRFVRFND